MNDSIRFLTIRTVLTKGYHRCAKKKLATDPHGQTQTFLLKTTCLQQRFESLRETNDRNIELI